MSASNDVKITSESNDVEVKASAGTIDLDAKIFTLDTSETSTIMSTGNYSVTTGGNATMTASNGVGVTAGNGITTTATTGNIATTASAGEVNTTANTNVNVTATSNNITLTATTGDVNVTAGDNITNKVGAGNKFEVQVNNQPTLWVEENLVTISSNLNVYGVINSVGITNTNLEIEDVILQLGYDSNTPGGYSNHGYGGTSVFADGAGVEIMNTPGSNLGSNNWNKHLKWFEPVNYDGLESNSGYTGVNSVDHEAKWELRGGALQLVSKDVKYSIRIGANRQLEFHKAEASAPWVYDSFKKVAVFGR